MELTMKDRILSTGSGFIFRKPNKPFFKKPDQGSG